jgi:hypothetical protein
MKTYKIVWLEFHACHSDKEVKQIIQNDKHLNINTRLIGNTDPDDKYWLEFECSKKFKAKNVYDAIHRVENYIIIDSDTYSVFDEKNKIIATEEGLVEESFCPYCKTNYNDNDGHSCWEQRSGLA